MKIKQILTGCIAALTLAGAAHAATNHIYLTGSSAFRSQTNAGLQALYGAPVAKDNAALGSANNVMYIKANYPAVGDTTYVITPAMKQVAIRQRSARTDFGSKNRHV